MLFNARQTKNRAQLKFMYPAPTPYFQCWKRVLAFSPGLYLFRSIKDKITWSERNSKKERIIASLRYYNQHQIAPGLPQMSAQTVFAVYISNISVGSISYLCRSIDLVTVFDAILTSRQTREKLQCLYENLMSNNFLKKAVLNKILIVN